jgi:hypothetical protein
VDATFIRVKNGNHNLTAPDMEPNMDEIERRMLEFLDKHLKPQVDGKPR